MKKMVLRSAGCLLILSSLAACVAERMPLDSRAQVPEPQGDDE